MNRPPPILGGVMLSAWLLAGMLVLGSVSACSTPPVHADDRAVVQEPYNEHLASRGFYQRRARGIGWFMTRSDAEMTQNRTLSDALRIVPGVNVIARGEGAMVVSNRSGRACPLAVFVDGLYTTIRNVDELTLEDLEAVEVYRGPSEVPMGFSAPPTEHTCGALLVWSRIEPAGD